MNLSRQTAGHQAEKYRERQHREGRTEGKRQMVGNGRENDSYSYHRCVSVFKTLNAYIFEKFKHSN